MPQTGRCACRLPGAATAPQPSNQTSAPEAILSPAGALAGRWNVANSNAVSSASYAAGSLP